MSLNKQVTVDHIEVLQNDVISYREVTSTTDAGREVAKTYHRVSLMPGQAIDECPENVKIVCAEAWTPAVVDAYQASLQKI